MAITFVKGYTNTSAATTDDTLKSAYNLKFATNYVKQDKAVANGEQPDPAVALYANRTSLSRAKEWLYTNIRALTKLKFKGAAKDFDKTRPRRKGTQARMFNVCLEGWDLITDPANSDFDEYTTGYCLNLSFSYEEDDNVTAAVNEERLERLLSSLVSNDGATSRISELMTGAMLNAD
jgi:hypothetical protein